MGLERWSRERGREHDRDLVPGYSKWSKGRHGSSKVILQRRLGPGDPMKVRGPHQLTVLPRRQRTLVKACTLGSSGYGGQAELHWGLLLRQNAKLELGKDRARRKHGLLNVLWNSQSRRLVADTPRTAKTDNVGGTDGLHHGLQEVQA